MRAYVQPRTIEELVEALAEAGAEAKILAGGTDLMIAARAGKTFGSLVNVSRVEGMDAIALGGATLSLGAGVTVAKLLASAGVRAAAPLVWQAADRFASPLVRSRATVGGNLCNASPAADLALALLAHDASVELVSRAGRRTLPLERFLVGPGRTALAAGEALARVSVPLRAERLCHFEKSGSRPALEIALASMAMAISVDGGRVVDARICFGAVAPVPLRGRATEAAVNGRSLAPPVIEDAVRAAVAEIRPIDDVRATAVYRRRLVAAFVRRGLDAAALVAGAARSVDARVG